MINHLILIDDDEVTLMICELIIKKENFADQVTKLTRGQQGLDFFRNLLQLPDGERQKHAPELILLDLNMPGMNGWDFLEEFSNELEDSFPETKVCILTSSVDPLDFSHSRVYSCVIDFISKPLTTESLQELKANEGLSASFSSK